MDQVKYYEEVLWVIWVVQYVLLCTSQVYPYQYCRFFDAIYLEIMRP